VKVAVITPFCRTPLGWLRQCLASVAGQSFACTHFLVCYGDVLGHGELHAGLQVLRVPLPQDDAGNAARAIGAVAAIAQGFDAIAYLDADNWYEPEHVRLLVEAHERSGAPVCSSGRILWDLEGGLLGPCREVDGEVFVDTNCLLWTQPAFGLVAAWYLMPHALASAGDRVVWQAVKEAKLPRTHHGVATVNCRTCHVALYPHSDRELPGGARDLPANGMAPVSALLTGAKDHTPTAALADIGPVLWEGDFCSLHSLAHVNRQLCQGLLTRGFALTPRHCASSAPSADLSLAPILAKALQRGAGPAAAVHVRQQWPPDWSPPAAGHWVVMQPWEFGSVPRAWVDALQKHVDDLWVPTSYVRDCFVKGGVPAERVHVVPHGVDVGLFGHRQPPFPLRTAKRFKFLYVGGTIHRKGIDVLLQAYTAAFTAADDICLVIKDAGADSFYRGQTAQEMIAAAQSPGGPEIEYLQDDLAPEAMAGLYQSCQCLVQPYRGEGFGLPILEAMACGLPVIVTGYGAALDFCDESRAFLLPARVVVSETARVGTLETVEPPWLAEPDVASLRRHLQFVVEHPEEARAKGAAAASHVRLHWTWDRAVDTVAQRLTKLRERPIRRFQNACHDVPAFFASGASANTSSVAIPHADGVRPAPRVSLLMIVRNEEANLADCLRPVAGLVDEIIVVDTGSADRSRDIARNLGARVVDFPWADDFAAARNEGLRHAEGEWIFWLDADDRLDEENLGRFRKLIGMLPDQNHAYLMKQWSALNSAAEQGVVVDHVRLFRRQPGVHWQFRVHEQILPSLRAAGAQPVWTDLVIHHGGYQSAQRRQQKLERNLRLLLLEYQDRPEEAFTQFNLGATYLDLGQPDQGRLFLERCVKAAPRGATFLPKAFVLLTRLQRSLDQNEAALRWCHEGSAQFPHDTELAFEEGLTHQALGDAARAQQCFERVLLGRAGPSYVAVDSGMRTYLACHHLALAHRAQRRLAEAERQWRAAVQECPSFGPAWLGLAELCLEHDRSNEVTAMAEELARNGRTAPIAAALRARLCLAQGDFAGTVRLLKQAIAKAPRFLWLRLFFTDILMQEGKDPKEAERQLLAILAQEPRRRQAQQWLQKLRQSKKEVALSCNQSVPANRHL
jgi:glycosyltransferase involved in cell wall biosynthesis/tetratricopeptide (TPR) repeat protein